MSKVGAISGSPSLRKVWIEIEKYAEAFKRVESPSAGKVWIEIDRTTYIELLDTSSSARKVWIEIGEQGK